MSECYICFDTFNINESNKLFKCGHQCCGECRSKLQKQYCPICRCQIKLIEVPKKRTQYKKMGKINLNKFSNIKTHLIFKYNLHFYYKITRKPDNNKRQRYSILRVLYDRFYP